MFKDVRALSFAGACAFAAMISPTPVSAASKASPRALSKLLDCRTLTDSAARLACYDEQVAMLDAATAKNDLVIMDKEDVRKTRRSLFGFTMPKLPFLDGGDDKERDAKAEVTQIDEVIKSARSLQYGIWALTLADGSEWQTTDAMTYGTPKTGLKIIIKRAALGSYKAKINNWPVVKIKRVG